MGYEPLVLGFFCSAKPPTCVIMSGFPSNKAHLENICRKKSTCGCIPRKASHMVTKLQTPLVEEPTQEPVRGVS